MLIFWEERLVILATPKTGSSALSAALAPFASIEVRDPPGLRHTGAEGFHRHIAPFLASRGGTGFETFAIMREPIDWLGSWYRYRARPEVDGLPVSTARLSFDAFLRAWCETPRPEVARVGDQASFLAPKGGPRVDRIYRYEDLAAAIAFLEARLERPIALPRSNVSPRRRMDVAPQTLALVQERGRASFALYAALPLMTPDRDAHPIATGS